ncbi:MAG: hypothetical protein ABH823_03270 [bacterium]
MKKTVILFCLLFLSLGIIQAGTALADKQEELQEVLEYVKGLDAKIVEARNKKEINRIAELKELKRGALAQAKALKEEIGGGTAVTEPEPVSVPVVESVIEVEEIVPIIPEVSAARKNKPLAGWWGLGGWGGGALLMELAYPFKAKEQNLATDFGLGIGNGYTILKTGIAWLKPVKQNYFGLELSYLIYSHTVTDIPGISGNISSGGRFALGFFGGTTVNKIDFRLGYNSGLGITLMGVYKF